MEFGPSLDSLKHLQDLSLAHGTTISSKIVFQNSATEVGYIDSSSLQKL